jgi:hypothetical protein
VLVLLETREDTLTPAVSSPINGTSALPLDLCGTGNPTWHLPHLSPVEMNQESIKRVGTDWFKQLAGAVLPASPYQQQALTGANLSLNRKALS